MTRIGSWLWMSGWSRRIHRVILWRSRGRPERGLNRRRRSLVIVAEPPTQAFHGGAMERGRDERGPPRLHEIALVTSHADALAGPVAPERS